MEFDSTSPLGERFANQFGLFDMSGNVLEWCEDRWHDNYDNAPDDGSAWLTGNIDERVLRGGSYFEPTIRDFRVVNRIGCNQWG